LKNQVNVFEGLLLSIIAISSSYRTYFGMYMRSYIVYESG